MSDIAYKAILPEGWPRPRGFSHAVVSRGSLTIRVAGQIGSPPGGSVAEGTSVGEQWKAALGKVLTVVRAAGGDIQNIVILRAFVTDIAAFNAAGRDVGEAWGATLGKHFPAMTLVEISKLVDPNACVEIEAEAVLP